VFLRVGGVLPGPTATREDSGSRLTHTKNFQTRKKFHACLRFPERKRFRREHSVETVLKIGPVEFHCHRALRCQPLPAKPPERPWKCFRETSCRSTGDVTPAERPSHGVRTSSPSVEILTVFCERAVCNKLETVCDNKVLVHNNNRDR
jgi:hypothetical protein